MDIFEEVDTAPPLSLSPKCSHWSLFDIALYKSSPRCLMIATGMMDPTTQFTCFTLYIRKSYWGVMLISNLANLFPLGKKTHGSCMFACN